MSNYQVFARKYRPQVFSELLGQNHITQTITNAITQNRIAQAYLFVGPRGTGKTSIARILAKALNCEGGPKVDFNPEESICQQIGEGRCLDVLEIDGASNNSVDQVRDLCANVQFMPSQGRFKIYYIDEVHMLSTQAFNALLKTLEEPPQHIKFIFATTEAHKILPTIISRCQRFDLHPISEEIISSHLQNICKKEKIEITETATFAIAKGAQGGMRDAQSMLDQLVAFCGNKVEEKDVLEIFGFPAESVIQEFVEKILTKDTAGSLLFLREQEKKGKDLSQLLINIIQCFRELLTAKITGDLSKLKKLEEIQKPYDLSQLTYTLTILAKGEQQIKSATHKRLYVELTLIQAIQSLRETSITELLKILEGKADSSQANLPKKALKKEISNSTFSQPSKKEKEEKFLQTEKIEAITLWKEVLKKAKLKPIVFTLLESIDSKEINLNQSILQISPNNNEEEILSHLNENLQKIEESLQNLKDKDWKIEISSSKNESNEEEKIHTALEIFEGEIG